VVTRTIAGVARDASGTAAVELLGSAEARSRQAAKRPYGAVTVRDVVRVA
jgi:hypothetical protein